MRASHSALLALVFLTGCTNLQLRRNTISQAGTLPDLQHQMVLDNLAAFACNPDAIPFQVNLRDGSAQISDFGSAGTQLITHWFVALIGTRTKTDQWGMVPVTDETTLRLLRIAYHRAFGSTEDLYSNDFANDLAHHLAKQTPQLDDLRALTDLFKASPPKRTKSPMVERTETRPGFDLMTFKKLADYKHFVESTIATNSARIVLPNERIEHENINFVQISGTPERYLVATPLAAEVRRQIYEIEEDLKKIQPGWFRIACDKHEIPNGACLVGHCKDCGKHCYVWVLPEGRAAFEDFTLRILKFSSLLKESQVMTIPGLRYVPSPSVSGAFR